MEKFLFSKPLHWAPRVWVLYVPRENYFQQRKCTISVETAPPSIGLLVLLNQQAEKGLTVPERVFDSNYQREISMLLHYGGG